MTSPHTLFSLIQTSSLQVPIAASMLELVPGAALLVHLDNQRILAANSAAIALSAYNRRQLLRHTVPQLLENFDLREDFALASEQRHFQRRLITGNGKRHPVRVTCYAVGEDTPWGVLLIRKVIHHPQTRPVPPAQWERLFIEALAQIAQAVARHAESEHLWEHLLRAIQPLAEARLMALYQVGSADFRARRLAALPADAPFPARLDAPTLSILHAPLLWGAESQPHNALERTASAHRWRYLACAPVEMDGTLLGVLCAADPQRQPSPRLHMALHTMSTVFAMLIRQHGTLVHTRRRQTRLEEELRLYHLLAEYMPLGALILDGDKRIRWLNPETENLLGYQQDEITGWAVEDVIIGADNFTQQLHRALQGEIIHSLGEKCELHRRNGASFPANVQIIPMAHSAQVSHLLVLIEDISQHKAMVNHTRKLEQQARLGEVTSIFAHEVRNPINNIQMGLQLLSASLPPDDDAQDTLQRMQSDLARLTQLMDSVLAFSRSHVRQQQRVLDLRRLLENLLSRWRPRCARQGVQQRFEAPEGLPKILAHAPSLEQVFNNLFSNALRAMPDGGTLAVRINTRTAREGKSTLRIDVADTGVGIPPEIQEQIFKPFFTTDQKKGTGLGLAITQQIITEHKGNIRVHSYPGGGTIFRIYLPAIESPAPCTEQKENTP